MSLKFNPLRELIGREKVLTDAPALTAYSIDASIYKAIPKAVVLIESKADLAQTLRFAKTHGIPLTARSGGTNLTGNAVGEGIILEFSRLHQMLEIDPGAGWARVQPGIVYAELNKQLAEHEWIFAPDPSSGDMCKLGGMLGNNAAGPHTLKYGATKDNVLEMTVLLASGRWITAKDYRLNDPALDGLFRENPELRTLYNLIRQNKDLILSHRKKVSKNASGYNLFALAEGLNEGHFPLHQLFIGSEGTLGLTLEAKIRLVPKPSEIATGLIYLKSLSDVGAAVADLLPLSPSALEMMDANSLDLVGRERFEIPRNADVMLLLEFDQSAKTRMSTAQDLMRKCDLAAPMAIAYDPEKTAALWRVRKAMYPTLYRYDEKKRPINFADDVVVAAARIPELVAYLEKLFSDQGVAVAIYGHIGDGNAHINPLLNLNDPADFNRMIALSHEIHETVIEHFGGSLCGEHGDGRVRAEFLKKLYGPELYALFKSVKRIFDPDHILNPGIKISETPFTENIDLHRLSKKCATCAKCNAVCPVYDVEREESNAARGWFHILTDPDYAYADAARVVEACINCKSCRSVCPAGIDVSEYVLKAREARPNAAAGKLFALQANTGLFEGLLKAAAWTQPLWDTKPGRKGLEVLSRAFLKDLAPTARIPFDMILPRIAKKTLRERHSERIALKSNLAYFHGCAANYFDDGVGDAVIALLTQHGFAPALPPQRCSGTPIQTYGWNGRVRENARFNLDALAPYERVVTGCASCTFMLKDYPALFADEGDHAYREKAEHLSKKVLHITELLPKEIAASDPEGGAASRERVTYHSSCHLRAAGVSRAPRDLLCAAPNIDFVEMPDAERCAGGAGTFCIKNPEQSAEIFARKRRGIKKSGA
ncbi:MAG: FAD-binding and (Fe-S)-binding domain-containing protein, partial [Nitrospiria bacterium]